MSLEAPMSTVISTETPTFINSSCLDFLMIELVPLSRRVTQQLDDGPRDGAASKPSATSSNGAQSGAGVVSASGSRNPEDEDEQDAVFGRLDSLGYRVGQGLVERFSRDRPRFNDTLDVIKFLCKDLWGIAFGKQVDNLKTNHRGVYVLTDASFRPITRMSTDIGGHAVLRAKPFLCFPCGVIRGALAAMGIQATVQAETSELPAAIFHVKTFPPKV